MNNSDVINGALELIAAGFTCINIYKVHIDKGIAGVSPWATAFFTLWGIWNTYFYPANGLMFSFVGGLAIVTANATWLLFVFYYKKIAKKDKKL